MPDMHHFLLVYSHSARKLVEQSEYSDDAEAASQYTAKERLYRDRPDYEIVLVGSDSIETVKKTHGHYFTDATSRGARFSDFLPA